MTEPAESGFTRLWTIEDRAGPSRVPVYEGIGRALSPSQGFGDLAPVREPDPSRYNAWRVVGFIKGEPALPSMPLEVRQAFTLSRMLRLARKGCTLDIQAHYGQCQDPRDFNGGWDKILVIEGAQITNWGTNDLGALNQGDNSVINEAIDTSGLDMYEIGKLGVGEIAGATVTRELIDIAICDAIACGACGLPSDGCKVFFAISVIAGGSPGLAADVIYSSDGGATVFKTQITTLPVGSSPSADACVGTKLVVVSNADCAIHYANVADIVAGTAVWTRIATGLTCAAGSPNDLFSLGTSFTWIVGNGGYIYFSSDITTGVTVQDAGTATTQNLNDIHGFDENNLVAVGASNAVVFTRNGGATWASVLGPAVGVALNSIWMHGKNEWLVGTAGGRLFYTLNGGTTWTEIAFSGNGAGQVRDVKFATPTVGYMAHDTAAPVGRLFRTIDGGHSWYVVPESGLGAMPDNDRFNAIAACAADPNIVFAAGLAGNATDGFLLKAAAARP